MQSELGRIDRYVHGEVPPVAPVKALVLCPQGAQAVCARVREVMKVIATQDPDAWPTDEEWIKLLPTWFTRLFQERTIEEVIADETLWTFGSWLDVMKSRGWAWWSSHVSDEQNWRAYLIVYEWPFSVGALEYLIRSSGASEVKIYET